MFDKLNKYVVYAIYVLAVMSMVNGCNSCNTSKEVSKIRKEVDTLDVSLNKFKQEIYTKEESDVRMSIEGYEISKRMLYDQNAIVRTVMRPDDRMAEYDLKIKELREKLK
jgi:hypothetical protein